MSALLFARRAVVTIGRRSLASQPPLTVDRLSGDDKGIVLMRMNRPQTKNAISKEMLLLFCDAVEQAKFDVDTRVIIIKSDVLGAFCTGADLKERAKMSASDVPIFVDAARHLMSSLEALPQPVLAALDGYALGGGLEMALAADVRVAASTAKLGLTETKLAIIPGAGGTQRLTRCVGVARAKELIYTAAMIDGAEAERIGLANHCVPQNEQGDAAYVRILEMARLILNNGPIALRMAKLAIGHGAQCDLTTGLAIEQQCYAQVLPTSDRIEALHAFREKRKPVFKGE